MKNLKIAKLILTYKINVSKRNKIRKEGFRSMDIDIDGLAERYWSAYDPAFQDDDEEENEYEEEDEG